MLVMCQVCREKGEKDEMEFEIRGQKSKQKKYYHPECYKKYLKDKEFKEKERLELDELYETIKEIHEIDHVPSKFFPFLMDIRNGSLCFGRIKKQYKKGIRYKNIEYTYRFCEKTIKYWKQRKDFDSTLGELKYGLVIVSDNIQKAGNDFKRKQRQKEQLNQKEEQIIKTRYESKNTSYKKQKHENDISDFL